MAVGDDSGMNISEEYRLRTFHQWPTSSPVTPRDLAKAGFLFVKFPDRVRCFSCRIELFNWTAGDTPIREHRRLSAQCPFLIGTDTRNIPLQEEGYGQDDATDSPRFINETDERSSYSPPTETNWAYPDYVHEDIRLATLLDHRWYFLPGETGPTPKLLASAGFFYLGPGDRVRCFSSGCVLKNWHATDDPWLEHVRHYPTCHWVTQQRGRAFIADVLISATSQQPRIGSLNDDGRRLQVASESRTASATAASVTDEKTSSQDIANTSSPKSGEVPATHLCKVCLAGPLETLFMPCKHLATCRQCATQLETCPLCRQTIEEALRIYI